MTKYFFKQLLFSAQLSHPLQTHLLALVIYINAENEQFCSVLNSKRMIHTKQAVSDILNKVTGDKVWCAPAGQHSEYLQNKTAWMRVGSVLDKLATEGLI